MKCENIAALLSEFHDDVLEPEKSKTVSGHLEGCAACRGEYDRLTRLKGALGSLRKIEAPDYLRHMVQLHIANAEHDTWPIQFRESLEYRWSKIRSTGSLWYVTRILGTAATFVLFVAITAAVKPIYLEQMPRSAADSHLLRQQLWMNVLKNLGYLPIEAQRRPIGPSEAMLNDLYPLNFGQNASRATHDDTVSVVAVVDRSGSATVRDVLEYPADSALLNEFNTMIQTARFRPASQNGKPVSSHLVMTFSKMTVYD